MRNICPVCKTPDPIQIDYREGVPVFLNRLGASLDDARASACGTLDIVGCSACGFVWNRQFDAEKVTYDPEYENDQTHSPAFREHLKHVAGKILAAIPGNGPVDIVEVGCGQGVFLSAISANAGPRLRSAVGFDPAFRLANVISDPRVQVFREYFTDESVSLLALQPSLVVTRHTIEHVADPVGFLTAIRRGIGTTGARLIVETPDVDWILKRGEIEDLFYEHCSLFTAESLSYALRAADFVPGSVETIFGGQYLLADAATSTGSVQTPALAAGKREFPDLAQERVAFIETWRSRIEGRKTVVWGAGAKGVTFCTLVDPEAQRIASLVDINPGKQEKFVPISGHTVFAPTALTALQPELVIVMNPNYHDEIEIMLRDLKISAEILVLGNT